MNPIIHSHTYLIHQTHQITKKS